MSTFAAALRSAVRRATALEFANLARGLRQMRRDLRALRREGDATRATRRLVSPLRGRNDSGPEIPPREVLAFRKGLGLGRNAFGKLVGVSHGTVYLWEVGRVAPRGFNRQKYLRAKKRYGRKAKLPAASLKG